MILIKAVGNIPYYSPGFSGVNIIICSNHALRLLYGPVARPGFRGIGLKEIAAAYPTLLRIFKSIVGAFTRLPAWISNPVLLAYVYLTYWILCDVEVVA